MDLDADYPPPTNCWPKAPLGGRGGGLAGVWEGRWGRGGRLGAGVRAPWPSVAESKASHTSPCPPSNHTITLNPTLTFAAICMQECHHLISSFLSFQVVVLFP